MAISVIRSTLIQPGLVQCAGGSAAQHWVWTQPLSKCRP